MVQIGKPAIGFLSFFPGSGPGSVPSLLWSFAFGAGSVPTLLRTFLLSFVLSARYVYGFAVSFSAEGVVYVETYFAFPA